MELNRQKYPVDLVYGSSKKYTQYNLEIQKLDTQKENTQKLDTEKEDTQKLDTKKDNIQKLDTLKEDIQKLEEREHPES